jgi:VCBS repeat-containing protein
MTIDSSSGLLEWTPNQIGDQSITVQVINLAGSDQQTYSISVNARPQAVSDTYEDIQEGTRYSVPSARGVLNNDSDEDDASLTAILESNATHGTINLNEDGSFTYIHDGSSNLTDSFTYLATDGKAESAPTAVSLTILHETPPASNGGGSGGGCFIGSLF